ncbi:MAG TPA: sulfatase/phosphatase domain-containing protein, partial [Bacteroidales bacterium]|nr:sulfatase/phosphatase domain-containing protein [Bacteroidales bacterium]
KCNLYDGGTGIFLIMRGPGGFNGGKVVDSLVSVIDVFPTVCELLDIEQPDWLDGTSFMPLIRGEKEEIRDAVYSQVNYHASYEPMRSVRTKRWKYIKRYGNRRKPVLPNCDDGLTKTFWMENGWKDQILPDEELFDLYFDPHERRNLANDSNHKKIRAELQMKLEKQMKESNDPMIKGYIKAPPDARVNDPDGISPKEKPRTAAELYDFNN